MSNESGVIVISLSKALKTEKEKNKQLQEEMDEIKKGNTPPAQKNTDNKTGKSSDKTSTNKSKTNAFSLPDN